MRTDHWLRGRLGCSVDLTRRVLIRIAALHRDPCHGPVLVVCADDMVGIADVAARRTLTFAQEEYVRDILSLRVHAALVRRLIRDIQCAADRACDDGRDDIICDRARDDRRP